MLIRPSKIFVWEGKIRPRFGKTCLFTKDPNMSTTVRGPQFRKLQSKCVRAYQSLRPVTWHPMWNVAPHTNATRTVNPVPRGATCRPTYTIGAKTAPMNIASIATCVGVFIYVRLCDLIHRGTDARWNGHRMMSRTGQQPPPGKPSDYADTPDLATDRFRSTGWPRGKQHFRSIATPDLGKPDNFSDS